MSYEEFESLVNLEGCKTLPLPFGANRPFESLVNLEGCKTKPGGNHRL